MYGQFYTRAHASSTGMITMTSLVAQPTSPPPPLRLPRAVLAIGRVGTATIKGLIPCGLPSRTVLYQSPGGVVRVRTLPLPSLPRHVTCREGGTCRGVTRCRTLDSDLRTSPTSLPCLPIPNGAAARTFSYAVPTLQDGRTSGPSPPTVPTWPPRRPLTRTSAPPYRRRGRMARMNSTLGGRNATSPCPLAIGRQQTPPTSPAPNQIRGPRGEVGAVTDRACPVWEGFPTPQHHWRHQTPPVRPPTPTSPLSTPNAAERVTVSTHPRQSTGKWTKSTLFRSTSILLPREEGQTPTHQTLPPSVS